MRKAWISLAVVLVGGGALLLAGCASTPKADPAAFENAVKAIWVDYSDLWKAGDIDNWIKLWDTGGVQLPPNSPMKMSLAEITASSKAAQAAYKWTSFSIGISGTFVDHDFGFVYGNYKFTFVPRAGGNEMLGDGKYETIFKRQADGTWKIYRDCFNSNLP